MFFGEIEALQENIFINSPCALKDLYVFYKIYIVIASDAGGLLCVHVNIFLDAYRLESWKTGKFDSHPPQLAVL